MKRPKGVYLVNFACYKPNKSFMCSKEFVMERASYNCNKENTSFINRVLEKSGLGQQTYLPRPFHFNPVIANLPDSKDEARMVMFGAIDELLSKTCVCVDDIGIFVPNSSIFNPTPSLSSMVHSNSYALVVSLETLTSGIYTGNDRSMLIGLTMFRMGGAAILLSNRSFDHRHHSKYKLSQIVGIHMGNNDKSYNVVFQQEDIDNKTGTSLSKDIMVAVGEALKTNITKLGPLILPISEQLRYFICSMAKIALKNKIKPYVPDFKLAIKHFCIHPGGRGVLDVMQTKLELTEWHLEPSRMTLYRFGNTSSSGLWYELAYSEAKGRVKKGDRVWKIAFGSGFKCYSAVWRALRNINPKKEINPWMDEINEFPVYNPKE